MRPITAEEGEALAAWYREAGRIETVLSQADESRAVKKIEATAPKAEAPPEEGFSLEFEAEAEPEPKPEPKPKKKAAPKKAEPKQEVAEETSEEPNDKLSVDLDNILAGLENA